MVPAATTISEITSLSASELAEHIASGEFSACEAVEAHIARIETVNPRLNALVVPLFDQARAEAKAADACRAQRRILGPLHGVPITIKELFDVAGTATTVGLSNRVDRIASQDAPLVSRLRRAGAIVLGKTNVPQLGMGFESANPVFGRTSNPRNVDRTPGGSSGGEAAIIAAGGSPLGLGSDAGGSIRQPAHSCGICGLKPTAGRLTMRGHWMVPNWRTEWIQPGPLARSVADLELALGVLNNSQNEAHLDRTVAPAMLRSSADISLEGLRIGFYIDDGCIRPGPAIRRAVKEAVTGLVERGCQVEEFLPPVVQEVWRLYAGLFWADGGHFLKEELLNSKIDPRIKRDVVWFSRIPGFARPPLGWLIESFGQRWFGRWFQWLRQRSLPTSRYLKLLEEQEQYRERFTLALDEARLDAIVCPVSPVPAFAHDSQYATMTASYTVLYNLLGMPAGVVPATRVRAGEESDRAASWDAVEREVARTESGSAGLPVGVQVVARHWREDVVLLVMRALEAYFRTVAEAPRN